LLCGGSCGAAVCGALEAAQSLGEGQRCVVVLADSIRNYMSKFLSDDWMYENGFVDERITNHRGSQLTAWWARKRIADLEPTSPITITPDVTCREAIEIMSAQV
jgi:cystathionine beta-synthase